jgi:hypothetical protein
MFNYSVSPPQWLVKSKKLVDFWWFYNPFLKQHLGRVDGPMHIYDDKYNLIYKEPKLRYAEEIQFIDADLCVANTVSSNKVILYSMTKRDIIFSVILKLPENMGQIFAISSVWLFKAKHTLVFQAVWRENVDSLGCDEIFAYDITSKKYFPLYKLYNLTTGYTFNDRFFYGIKIDGKDGLLAVNSDLTCEIIKFDDKHEELRKNHYRTFDQARGVLVFGYANEPFDGYTYYGNNYSKIGFDLTGKPVLWEPANRIDNIEEKPQIKDDSETYIRKHGVDVFAINNYSDEEIIHGGYFWTLDNIEKKAKKAGVRLQDFIGNEQITELENVLYAIGWFETELGEGGFGQYVFNGEQFEFDFLIKALNLVGAKDMVKVVRMGVKLKVDFKNRGNSTDNDYERLTQKLNDFADEINEEYVQFAVEYCKNKIGKR